MIAPDTAGSGGSALPRRLLTCGALGLALLLVGGGLPLWALLALGVDLVRPRIGGVRRYATLRCLGFFLAWLICEAVGVVLAVALWVVTPRWDPERFLNSNYGLQRSWGSALVAATLTLFDMQVHIQDDGLLDGRPILLFVRHTSLADGVLALPFVCQAHGYRLRYVLKEELRFDPCLDIVGHRIPNAFVKRDGSDSAREIARVEGLLDGLGQGDGVLLFPEGTRNTPARRERALAKLAESASPEVLARARMLRHTLPPRPGGAGALLAKNPGADVVLWGHTGLEGAIRFWDFLDGALVGRTLRMRFWRYPASEVPKEPEAAYLWLLDRWVEMDGWVHEGA